MIEIEKIHCFIDSLLKVSWKEYAHSKSPETVFYI